MYALNHCNCEKCMCKVKSNYFKTSVTVNFTAVLMFKHKTNYFRTLHIITLKFNYFYTSVHCKCYTSVISQLFQIHCVITIKTYYYKTIVHHCNCKSLLSPLKLSFFQPFQDHIYLVFVVFKLFHLVYHCILLTFQIYMIKPINLIISGPLNMKIV